MPRYVLLRHELPSTSGRVSHWDFMLEHEGKLWTWMLEGLPKSWLAQLNIPHEDASEEVPARRLDDHRISYLEYEGPVSGDRGSVTRMATGEYTPVENTIGRVAARLAGGFRGIVTLGRRNESPEDWQLRFATEL